MSEIISIDGAKVKIGTDDGKIVNVPIAALNYAGPKVGDKVKIFKDADSVIVMRDGKSSGTGNGAARKMNKHVFVWVGNFLFGGLGVDRFMRGQVGLGLLKLFFGWMTFGIWPLVDWIISLVKAYSQSDATDGDNILFTENGSYLA